uniref:Uncharacterized protein n=1 Tax=Arundo donax TaxID=35708 RepID=A0A0A8YHA9_ARUDO
MSDESNNYINMCFSIERYKMTFQHVLQRYNQKSMSQHGPVSPILDRCLIE